MTKFCRKCGETKDTSEFHKAGKNGFQKYCKPCRNAFNRAYSKTDEYREKRNIYFRSEKGAAIRKNVLLRYNNSNKRKSHLLHTVYGVTLEWKDKKIIEQGGVCAICKVHFTGKNKESCVDHDHKTGNVRGVLCNTCNRCAGLLHDNYMIAESMANYLREYDEQYQIIHNS